MSTPPVRYPGSASFDVNKYDGKLDSNFCTPGSALESAYASNDNSAGYDRMYGTRGMQAIEMHVPRDPGCLANDNSSPETYDLDEHPTRMYGRGAPEPADRSARVIDHVASSASKKDITERARLYDILVFILFGLLLVLAMHEIAALGEVIGRTRAASYAAAQRAMASHRHVRFP